MRQIYQVVLYLGEARLQVIAIDHDSHRRVVDQTWKAKEFTNTPPDKWADGIEAEVQHQRTQEANKESGRMIF